MWILIDGIQDFLELALIENNQIIATTKEKQNRNLTKILIPNFANFLNENKIDKKNIEKIFVINGPGSFTCVKLISVFVNAFKSIFNNTQILTLNSLWWYASENKTISLMDAKTNLFYFSYVDVNKPKKIYLINQNQKEKLIQQNPLIKNYLYSINNIFDINKRWNFAKDLFDKVDFVKPLYIKDAV